MGRYFNLRRLVSGAFVVLAIVLPAYLTLFRGQPEDNGLYEARLLDTPPTAGATRVGLDEGNLAPDFELPTPQGGRIRLSDQRGQPVLVNFWATWCGSCLSEMPDIAALQKEKGEDAFAVLAINAGQSSGEAREFIDFLDAPFLYGLDRDLVIADAYGVYGLPLSVFIDAGGVVRGVYRGHADRTRLLALTDAAIEARQADALAPAVRLISTIPRERILTVSKAGTDRIVLASRSLRCDVSYCAQLALAFGEAPPGVRSISFSPQGSAELARDFGGAGGQRRRQGTRGRSRPGLHAAGRRALRRVASARAGQDARPLRRRAVSQRNVRPMRPETTEAASTPSFASSISAGSSKARPVINNDTVKPMPASRPTPAI
jgi:thiol-disulfide isomerase/thioredoxin